MPDPAPMTYAPAMSEPTRSAPSSAGSLTHGWVRLARGAILGGSSLLLATGAHMVAGGRLPGGGLLALTGVALALVAVSLTTRRVRFVPLVAVLGVEQVLLHLLFHAAGTAASCAAVAMPGHAMTTSTVCSGGGATSSAGWSMLVAHVFAVVATAWLLARGERWLWRMVDRAHAYATVRPTRRRLPRLVVAPAGDPEHAGVGWLTAGPRGPPVALI